MSLSILRQNLIDFTKSDEYQQYQQFLESKQDPEELDEEKRKTQFALFIPPEPTFNSNENDDKTPKKKFKFKFPKLFKKNTEKTEIIVEQPETIPVVGEIVTDTLQDVKNWNKARSSSNLPKIEELQIGRRNSTYTNVMTIENPKVNICSTCGLEISKTVAFYLVQQKPVHKDCFKCYICGLNLDGKQCIIKNNKFYCFENGCNKQALDKCSECNEVILAEHMVYKDKLFHVHCLKCTQCRTLLNGNFYTIGENPYCVLCADQIC